MEVEKKQATENKNRLSPHKPLQTMPICYLLLLAYTN